MRIIGCGVCGPGEASRYLKQTLQEFQRLCDDVIICCNNTDLVTEKMIADFGFWHYRDDREWGKYQPQIKTYLIDKYVRRLRPDWVLFLDMDEVFEERIDRKILEELAKKPYDICYAFWILDLWNTPEQYREDFLFETFRFWRFIPNVSQEFNNVALHCGNAPALINQTTTFTNYAIKHYGLLKKVDREQKIARYKKYDPQSKLLAKGWYEALATKQPPLVPIETFYNLNLKPIEFKKTLSMPMSASTTTNTRQWRFRRIHDNIFITTTDERHYNELIKKKDKFVYEGMEMPNQLDMPVAVPLAEVPIIPDPLECILCGYVAKTNQGIKLHKSRTHKE